MIGLTILGSTGSIGTSTLDVVRLHADRYRVVALTANRNVDRLLQQCLEFKPNFAVMVDQASAHDLRQRLKEHNSNVEVLHGMESLDQMASLDEVSQVMAAIVGAAGLNSSLAAARAGKRILLANKESLVLSGKIFMDEVAKYGAELLPIDSEHNAVFQCMPTRFSEGLQGQGVDKILLTASGGPFRTASLEELDGVTPAQACAHPNWEMGRKISVDSATMMNKGLEVIEAHWIFSAEPDQIEVVIHPQSVIHSMVQYVDGSVLAQLGNPDMRTPIAHAMAWPERFESGVKALDIFEVARLDFEKPDLDRFPCLGLAFEVMREGGTAPAILNAANEEAVAAFLDRGLPFMRIGDVVKATLDQLSTKPADSIESILAADQAARSAAMRSIQAWS